MTTDNQSYDIDATIDLASAETPLEPVDAPEPTNDVPVDSAETVTEAIEAEGTPAVPPQPEVSTPGVVTQTPNEIPDVTKPFEAPGQTDRLQQLEQQNLQFQQQQRQQQLESEVSKIQSDLEGQGYLPEQASQIATTLREQAERESKIVNAAQQRESFLRGQYTAAIKFVQDYGLNITDIEMLRAYNTPAEMEREAKRMSETKEMQTKIATYEQGRVPTQQFDTGQSSPAAGRSRDRLLDDYINGRISLTPEQYNRLTNGR